MTDNEDDFEAALLAFEEEQPMPSRGLQRVGEKIKGTILSIDREFAFVGLGGKAEGQLSVEELLDSDGVPLYAVGDTIEALITAESPDGGFVLRLRPGQGPIVGEELRDAHRHGIPVEGLVSGINKGGAEVEVGGLRAFCPVSQLDNRYVEDPSEFVGRRLQFRITRFEDAAPGRRPNVVLSRRVLLEEEKRQRAEETRSKLEVGAVVTGEVSSIAAFGAFVDLGGLEGLLHVSEMSHSRISDPGELLAVGQRLEVEVLKIEPDPKGKGERIALSIRTLANDPWLEIDRQFPLGATVTGRVTRVESFGAFVELLPGIEGLVHVSELGAAERVRHAREVVSPGQEVQARVMGSDQEKHRLSLSIRAATAATTAHEEAVEKADFERRNQASAAGFGSMAELFIKAQQEKGKKH